MAARQPVQQQALLGADAVRASHVPAGDLLERLILHTPFASSSHKGGSGGSTSGSSDRHPSHMLALGGILAACALLAHCDAASAADSLAPGHPHWSAAIGAPLFWPRRSHARQSSITLPTRRAPSTQW